MKNALHILLWSLVSGLWPLPLAAQDATPTGNAAARADGGNITNPAQWRTNLDVPATGEVAVDNTAVNLAIATNPAATREAADANQLFYGPLAPRSLGRLSIGAPNNLRLTILSLGDSFTIPWISGGQRLGKIIGYGGGIEPPSQFSGTYGTALGQAGTTYPVSAYDWTRSINGKMFRLAVGETLILNASRADFLKKFHVFYNQENGAGTFKVEQDVGAGYVSVNAGLDSVDANNLGAITPSVASYDWGTSSQRALKITCLSGTVDIWGFVYSDDYSNVGASKGGIEVFRFGASSLNIANASTVPQSFFDVLIGTLQPDICSWKADDANYDPYMETYMDKVEAAAGVDNGDFPDWIFFGSHAYGDSNSSTWLPAEQQLLDIAISRHHCYVNSRFQQSNHAVLQDSGSIGSGDFHLLTSPSDWLVGQICAKIGDMLPPSIRSRYPTLEAVGSPFVSMLNSNSPWGNVMLSFQNANGGLNGSSIWKVQTSSASAVDMWNFRGPYCQDVYSNGRFYFAGSGGYGTTAGSGLPTSGMGAVNIFAGSRNEPLIKGTAGSNVTTSDLLVLATGAANSSSIGTSVFKVLNNGSPATSAGIYIGNSSGTGPGWTSGSGSPEGVVTAPIGSMYSDTVGGAGTTLYVKESGVGNTGWVAK